jgi:hypothetical protein
MNAPAPVKTPVQTPTQKPGKSNPYQPGPGTNPNPKA